MSRDWLTESDIDWLFRRVIAQERMLTHYRAGSRPSESLLDELSRTRVAMERIDAKAEAAK